LMANGARKVAAGVGTGPVDALSKAIQSALGEEIKLLNYKLEAISGGTDSLCTVEVEVEDDDGQNGIRNGSRRGHSDGIGERHNGEHEQDLR